MTLRQLTRAWKKYWEPKDRQTNVKKFETCDSWAM